MSEKGVEDLIIYFNENLFNSLHSYLRLKTLSVKVVVLSYPWHGKFTFKRAKMLNVRCTIVQIVSYQGLNLFILQSMCFAHYKETFYLYQFVSKFLWLIRIRNYFNHPNAKTRPFTFPILAKDETFFKSLQTVTSKLNFRLA